MLTALQAITEILYVGVAPLFAWVGWTHATRSVDDPASRRATRFFALYWFAIAFDAMLAAVNLLAGALGGASGAFEETVTLAIYASISVMMSGLLYYLVFLFTGRTWALWPIIALYVAMFVVGVNVVVTSQPTGLRMTRWASAVTYTTDPAGVGAAVLGFAFLLPPTIGALAYGAFMFRVHGATQRYRIALVSAGIFVWFVTSIVLGVKTLESSDVVQGWGRAVTLASILVVVAAYHPPAWVRRRWGIEPLVGRAVPLVHDPVQLRKRRAERESEMADRVKHLV